MAPWALEKARGLFAGWRQGRIDRAAEIAIQQMANAMLPKEAITFRLVWLPGTKNGFLRQGAGHGRISVRFEFISTAPVAIKPSRMHGMIAVTGHGCQSKDPMPFDRNITSNFLRTGGILKEEFDLEVQWDHPEKSPRFGEAVRVAVNGKLQLLAPWKEEYKDVEFGDMFHVPVTGEQ